MMNTILHKLSLAVVPQFYRAFTGLLFSTCHLQEEGIAYLKECEAAGPYIAAFWHYGIYYIIYQSRKKPWVAMVSASKDGEYVARLLNSMGHVTVRGSKGKEKDGVKALRRMTEWVKKGRMAAIVADGSQGPAHRVQAGAIILASRTGVPILPVAWSADRYYTFKSWDRSIIPKPFSHIYMCYGEPMTVSSRIRGEEFEEKRLELEKRLNGQYKKAWARFGRQNH
jgi:lysophospholipid acyltransferase (LPLAT)-like uncharacterized protein